MIISNLKRWLRGSAVGGVLNLIGGNYFGTLRHNRHGQNGKNERNKPEIAKLNTALGSKETNFEENNPVRYKLTPPLLNSWRTN